MISPAHIGVLLLLLACVQSSVEAPRALPNDAYIWQRVWTPALDSSIVQSANLVRTWRVLVSEINAHGQLTRIQPDWKVMVASNRPVVIVHRIDGRVERLDASRTVELTVETLSAAKIAGVQVSGVEIDFDCPTSRIQTYAGFLKALRGQLPAGVTLSITALPTWLSSPHLPELADAADETVLQVHAVLNPGRGLFDPGVTHDWVERWAERDRKPFRVALPAYGARVDWGPDGRLLAVTGEMPRVEGGARSAELIADPMAVNGFVRSLELRPPPNLAGVVWFRLPVAGDERAWSLPSWRAALQRSTSTGRVTVSAQAGDAPGILNIVIRNDSGMDAALPAGIVLDPACPNADGANGYALETSGGGLRLQRTRNGLLSSYTSRMIGWTRCTTPNPDFHAEP